METTELTPIEFTVEGIPPKKHGEKSMWDRNDEAPRVALMRDRALSARVDAGLNGPITRFARLELDIFVPQSKLESLGDLDNFITGICDGLQAAHFGVKHVHPVFENLSSEELHPYRAILLANDSRIVDIHARKIPVSEGEPIRYRVALKPIVINGVRGPG